MVSSLGLSYMGKYTNRQQLIKSQEMLQAQLLQDFYEITLGLVFIIRVLSGISKAHTHTIVSPL